jgi:hypothetical protein
MAPPQQFLMEIHGRRLRLRAAEDGQHGAGHFSSCSVSSTANSMMEYDRMMSNAPLEKRSDKTPSPCLAIFGGAAPFPQLDNKRM